jgi:hypothetical protein
MTLRKTPVIIGVGDFVNRSKKVEDAIEPLQLMILAIQEAIKDTGLDASQMAALQAEIDSVCEYELFQTSTPLQR